MREKGFSTPSWNCNEMLKCKYCCNHLYSSFVDKLFLILQIPITLHKEIDGDTMRCGFKIGGGIDQDFHKSPQGYTDNVSVLYRLFC